MSIRAAKIWRARMIAAAVSVIAIAAVAITVPAVVKARRVPAPLPLAPGLAALSGPQLAELLPTAASFPAGWTPLKTFDTADGFGDSGLRNDREADEFEPSACHEVAYGGRIGGYAAVTVNQHDPAGRGHLPHTSDIRLSIAREFDPSVFDAMRAVAAQCSHFHGGSPAFDYTLRILEDERPDQGPQRFRYRVSVTYGHQSEYHVGSFEYAYARISHLIITGQASDGHAGLMHQFFRDTLARAQQLHTPS